VAWLSLLSFLSALLVNRLLLASIGSNDALALVIFFHHATFTGCDGGSVRPIHSIGFHRVDFVTLDAAKFGATLSHHRHQAAEAFWAAAFINHTGLPFPHELNGNPPVPLKIHAGTLCRVGR
jgi:hypothetical protein